MTSPRDIVTRGALSAAALIALGGFSITAAAGVRPNRPTGGAGAFMVGLVRDKLEGDYDHAWQSLYPPHQRVASRAAYVGCESLIPPAGALVGVRAMRVVPESIRVAGQPRKTKTQAVTVRVGVIPPGWIAPITISQTFHAIAVRGHWTWILSTQQYADYSAGICSYS